MSGVAISTHGIVEAAREFELASKESQELAKRLQKAAERLKDGWSGETQEAFFAHHREWQSLMQAQVLLLTGISTELKALAARYQKADQ